MSTHTHARVQSSGMQWHGQKSTKKKKRSKPNSDRRKKLPLNKRDWRSDDWTLWAVYCCGVRNTHKDRQTDTSTSALKKTETHEKNKRTMVVVVVFECALARLCMDHTIVVRGAYFEHKTDEQTWLEWNNTHNTRTHWYKNECGGREKKSIYRPWNEPRQRNLQSAVETENGLSCFGCCCWGENNEQKPKKERKEMRKVIRNRTHTHTANHTLVHIHIIKHSNDWLNRETRKFQRRRKKKQCCV